MTKTLTEQWREGTIEYGLYYVRIAYRNDITIAHTIEEDLNVEEVLAPVPSYDEVKEMSQKIERLEYDNEALEMAHNEGKEIIAELKAQLNEANEVIKFFANSQIGKKNKDGTCGFWLCSGDVAFDNPLERINNKMKYTCYDPRPAKKWLKKWGVK